MVIWTHGLRLLLNSVSRILACSDRNMLNSFFLACFGSDPEEIPKQPFCIFKRSSWGPEGAIQWLEPHTPLMYFLSLPEHCGEDVVEVWSSKDCGRFVETTVQSADGEERLTSWPGPQWGACGCAHERNSMRMGTHLFDLLCGIIWGRQELRPSPSLTTLPATQACSVSSIHSLLPIFLSTSSMPIFRYFTPVLVQAQESPAKGWGSSVWSSPSLWEGDLKLAEEAGHSYLVYSVKKTIKMLPVFVSLPSLFLFVCRKGTMLSENTDF